MAVSVHYSSTAIVSTDPKNVPAVNEKAYNAGDTGRGIESLKRIAVISDKSAVAAYPDESIGSLGNSISF